ncbi:lipocalin-like domain-containing protein [Flavihumibacter fluvii]|uniref:lipocalin-like domain-containing protein n=1 Tax=Flavihumibacter fluvii TaxID=2838157 RepID=UPI001BDE9E1C|nr:lipocalin-like domain-containing protein [Flavihumibacter fluvii]ULQ53625.1 lipocalin-like domain-containing protein [Flavihumibacter fluvii]
MRLIILLTFLALAFGCKPGLDDIKKTSAEKIVGTWRLIDYEDFDTLTGKWIHLYGDHPKGYFTYTKSGIVNINGSAEKTLPISEDSAYKQPITIGALLDNAWGYFGTYTIDEENSIVTHHPTGGSIPWYIGTDQPRQFIIRGDTLFIGDPTFKIGKRVLIRED